MSTHAPINAAIAAFLASYADTGAEHVSAIVNAAKAAAAAKKGMQASLFTGFLALAESGADPQAIRASGAAIRRAVTRIMRTQAGFPADKPKGAKESGAPDFSTASVYAGVVSDCLGAARDNPAAWDAAFLSVASADNPPAEHACGLFETVSANKRALSKYADLCDAEMAHRYPALAPDGAADGTQSLASQLDELRRDNDALRARAEAALQPGDAAEALATARAERNSATEALVSAQDVVRRQAAELDELRAIAAEAARLVGAADQWTQGLLAAAELRAELSTTDAA